jgi:putative FmdB family regulatory protein
MPIFEYRCDDCGNKFEKLVRRSAEADGAECPSCGRDHVTTQVSSFAARTHAGKDGVGKDSMPACPSGMCATPGLCGRN